MLCHTPFIVHLYCEKQIILLKLLSRLRLILYFDATSLVVRKMEKSQNTKLYNAISVNNPEAPVPLEMLSSAHMKVDIALLMKIL